VSSTADIHYEQATDRDALSGSANWDFDNGTHPTVRPRIAAPSRTRSCQRLRFCAMLLAVSSMTAVPDPWCETQHQRSQLTMSSTLQTISRRRITPLEARKMALEILYRAEKERADVAQAEAERGVSWEEVS